LVVAGACDRRSRRLITGAALLLVHHQEIRHQFAADGSVCRLNRPAQSTVRSFVPYGTDRLTSSRFIARFRVCKKPRFPYTDELIKTFFVVFLA
uniref:Secreted protein n=1 Tax=Heligmosomoides polygyrus TaxID=6339 RepID=A0A183F6V0_HELPZ